jgi:hypothetical protein
MFKFSDNGIHYETIANRPDDRFRTFCEESGLVFKVAEDQIFGF